MMERGIRTREEESFMTVVLPAHDIRRSTIRSVHLDHLAVPVGLAKTMPLDHDPVSDACLHHTLPGSVKPKDVGRSVLPVGPKVLRKEAGGGGRGTPRHR